MQNQQVGVLVKPLEVLAEAVKMRREQLSMTQAELAAALTEHGMPVDSTAVVRIEQGQRAVRIDQLLSLAAALRTTPGHLLSPHYGRSLTVGDVEISAPQVLAWFAGNPDAIKPTTIVNFKELVLSQDSRRIMSLVLGDVQVIGQAIERGDKPAVIWGATKAHNTLSAMVADALPKAELERIWSDYDVAGDD